MNIQSPSGDVLDRIEREITVRAPAGRVWELVTAPGWWVNDGAGLAQDVEEDGPDRVIVHDPTHGDFAVVTVSLEPQRYAAFRWHPAGPDEKRVGALTPESSTLVEFFLEAGEEAVRLRVVESGFAALSDDLREQRAAIESNAAGWVEELALLGRTAEEAA